MPQASETWTEATAASFLEDAGYTYTNRLDWLRPLPVRRMTAEEESAAEYLRTEHEWGEVLP